ncbi:MAG TPA: glycosyltransferase [Gaiellaceae bacterium]|nr:glycosyltransferase [Gaiellaceae bacterium]
MWLAAEILIAFVAFYPVCTAAFWMAGGVLFRLWDEPRGVDVPAGGWPGVSVLVPAYNEERVVGTCVQAVLAADYPELEVIVLDDGSTDGTEAAALAAAGGDERCRVVRNPVNRGKADRLNEGFRRARHDLVVVTDADTHVHPQALKLLVARLARSPLVAAVAGAPHVTNRGGFLRAMQILEAAAIIGLIRRTQSLTGRVGVVAGVLGLFRRERVLAVGGYDPRMATEDIDLTWKLLLAGWHTAYEPRALVGMQVPTSLRALWAQRTRWARGQGEVLHVHLGEVSRWGNHRMWLLSIESVASLLWVVALVLTLLVSLLALALGDGESVLGLGLAWGIAVAVVATVQLTLALTLQRRYDPRAFKALLIGALYPIAFWTLNGVAALRSQTVGLISGPREERVVWDLPRDELATEGGSRIGTSPKD